MEGEGTKLEHLKLLMSFWGAPVWVAISRLKREGVELMKDLFLMSVKKQKYNTIDVNEVFEKLCFLPEFPVVVEYARVIDELGGASYGGILEEMSFFHKIQTAVERAFKKSFDRSDDLFEKTSDWETVKVIALRPRPNLLTLN